MLLFILVLALREVTSVFHFSGRSEMSNTEAKSMATNPDIQTRQNKKGV
jgi:hypothetical protein